MKLKFLSALVLSMLCAPAVFAISNDSDSGESEYRVPIYEGVEFEAELNDDGSVSMKWSPFKERDNDKFKYYKVMKSLSNSNPVYPEDDATAVKLGIGDTRHTDKWAHKSAYYRVCVITEQKGRYCSNVVWIEQGEDNRQKLHDDLRAENKEREERHNDAWEHKKCENFDAAGNCEEDSGDRDEAKKRMMEKMKHQKELMQKRIKEQRESMQKRMKPQERDEDSDRDRDENMEERMEAAFEKVQPKLDKFLDRVENVLVNSEKLSSEQKIKKIKTLQERFYKWEKGNKFKMVVVDYLDGYFMRWIEELEDDFNVDEMDSFLDDIFQE